MKKILFPLLMTLALSPCADAKKNAGKDIPAQLKVISFNVRTGKALDGENRWDKRKDAVLEMMDEQKPDIMGVQEALQSQVNYIDRHCKNYKNVGVGREDGKNEGEHMSVFYNDDRVKLLDWGTFWLSETPDVPSVGWGAKHPRTATWAKFRLRDNGKVFFFVNTHLDHKSASARKNGLKLISKEIKRMNIGKHPVILAGDFNVTPGNSALKAIGKKMLSARETAVKTVDTGSFNGYGKEKKGPQAIDYIYYSEAARCISFDVLEKPYGNVPFISDHWPISATIEF